MVVFFISFSRPERIVILLENTYNNFSVVASVLRWIQNKHLGGWGISKHFCSTVWVFATDVWRLSFVTQLNVTCDQCLLDDKIFSVICYSVSKSMWNIHLLCDVGSRLFWHTCINCAVFLVARNLWYIHR